MNNQQPHQDISCRGASTTDISTTLFDLTRAHHIPLIAVVELTHRCNLHCRHCYIDRVTAIPASDELSTDEVKHILDQLADAGTLHLVFTGGEIFLRPDLLELCRYARERSFDLRLFTNATLMSDEDISCLRSLNISRVEASVYGRAATHDSITGADGSWEQTTRAIKNLSAAGVIVGIKTPLMTINAGDRHWLKEQSSAWGIPVTFDPIIAPGNAGGNESVQFRLSEQQLREVYAEEMQPAPARAPHPDDLSCSAGFNMLSISPNGTMYPCLQLLLPLGNVRERSLNDMWKDSNPALASYRAIISQDIAVCGTCSLTPYCQRCPGLALLEDGSLTGPSRISCITAKIQADVSLAQ